MRLVGCSEDRLRNHWMFCRKLQARLPREPAPSAEMMHASLGAFAEDDGQWACASALGRGLVKATRRVPQSSSLGRRGKYELDNGREYVMEWTKQIQTQIDGPGKRQQQKQEPCEIKVRRRTTNSSSTRRQSALKRQTSGK